MAVGISLYDVQQQLFQFEPEQRLTKLRMVEKKRKHRVDTDLQQWGNGNGKNILYLVCRLVCKKAAVPVQKIFEKRIVDKEYQGSILFL